MMSCAGGEPGEFPCHGSPGVWSCRPSALCGGESDRTRVREAFDAFIDEAYDAALAAAKRFTEGDTALAQDLVQDAFVKMWSIVLTGTSEVTWSIGFAVTVVRNLFLDHRRRQARERKLIARAARPEAAMLDPDQRTIDRAVVLEFLRRLPDRHREIFFLSEVGGFKAAEVAELLKLAPGTVSNYLSSARKQLRMLASGLA
ncbi:sigma-70 family RNA polymerase sigma factor [Amycolatopsis sp. Poz14]|nr:sigma-70 family RNA polymerase sigma factor [Amycolatopsis sp. Poz14]